MEVKVNGSEIQLVSGNRKDPYCDDCWKDHARHEKGNWLKFKPEFIIRGWADGGWYERLISFEDEWNRYRKSLEG